MLLLLLFCRLNLLVRLLLLLRRSRIIHPKEICFRRLLPSRNGNFIQVPNKVSMLCLGVILIYLSTNSRARHVIVVVK